MQAAAAEADMWPPVSSEVTPSDTPAVGANVAARDP